jgi:hypothetical protein
MRKLLILAFVMCGAMYAYAGATNSGFEPTSSGPVEFTFLAWNNGNWQAGYPYEIQPTNEPGLTMAVMCDDYMHGGQPGDQWIANITNLGTGNISLARFNVGADNAYDLFLYEEAGWILKQTSVEPTTQWMAMNYAVWNIFDPNAPCNGSCQAWLAAAFINAKEEPLSYFDNVYIVTPVDQHNPDQNSMQEFLYLGQDPAGSSSYNSTVPEPGTLLLLGTGLVAVLRRKIFG